MKRVWSSLKGGWGKRAADWVNFRGQFSSLLLNGRHKLTRNPSITRRLKTQTYLLIPNDLENISHKLNTRRMDREKTWHLQYSFNVGYQLQEPELSRAKFLLNRAQ
jgi:hypothetical protein